MSSKRFVNHNGLHEEGIENYMGPLKKTEVEQISAAPANTNTNLVKKKISFYHTLILDNESNIYKTFEKINKVYKEFLIYKDKFNRTKDNRVKDKYEDSTSKFYVAKEQYYNASMQYLHALDAEESLLNSLNIIPDPLAYQNYKAVKDKFMTILHSDSPYKDKHILFEEVKTAYHKYMALTFSLKAKNINNVPEDILNNIPEDSNNNTIPEENLNNIPEDKLKLEENLKLIKKLNTPLKRYMTLYNKYQDSLTSYNIPKDNKNYINLVKTAYYEYKAISDKLQKSKGLLGYKESIVNDSIIDYEEPIKNAYKNLDMATKEYTITLEKWHNIPDPNHNEYNSAYNKLTSAQNQYHKLLSEFLAVVDIHEGLLKIVGINLSEAYYLKFKAAKNKFLAYLNSDVDYTMKHKQFEKLMNAHGAYRFSYYSIYPEYGNPEDSNNNTIKNVPNDSKNKAINNVPEDSKNNTINLSPATNKAMPEYNKLIEDALAKFFGDIHNYNYGDDFKTYLKTILKQHNAVISGGFILKSMGLFNDPNSVDIDIYVPGSEADKFTESMIDEFQPNKIDYFTASKKPGAGYFFFKNGIASVKKFSKNQTKITPYAEMDIVAVNDTHTPITVVKNFDLSFCQVWYDGENVYAAYPEQIKTKKGFLGNNYTQEYLSNNKITKKRMYKYIQRGFKIFVILPPDGTVKNVTQEIKNNVSLAPPPNTTAKTSNETPLGQPLPQPVYNGPSSPLPLPITTTENILNLIVTELKHEKYNFNSNVVANPVRLGGSNGAFLYVKKGEPGNFWVVKKGKIEQIQSEFIANDIYQAAGVRVPAHRLDGDRLIMKYIEGKTIKDATLTDEEMRKVKTDLCKDFVIDALIANWDVIGSAYDNIIIPSDGTAPVRIDSGGSLRFRAMGGIKNFDGEALEIHTMRSVGIQAAAVFGMLTDAMVAYQIKERLLPFWDPILQATPEDLRDVMQARMTYMREWADKLAQGGKRTKKRNRKGVNIRRTR